VNPSMLLCYVDESGDEQPLKHPTDPPVLVLAGVRSRPHAGAESRFRLLAVEEDIPPDDH
jgi:hypothetical protein